MLLITGEDLATCLMNLAPVELLGMTLLRSSQQLFPTGLPREVVKEAVTEMVAYTERCVAVVQQLRQLGPVPLTRVSILEYGL
jgi:hypothetical protein